MTVRRYPAGTWHPPMHVKLPASSHWQHREWVFPRRLDTTIHWTTDHPPCHPPHFQLQLVMWNGPKIAPCRILWPRPRRSHGTGGHTWDSGLYLHMPIAQALVGR